MDWNELASSNLPTLGGFAGAARGGAAASPAYATSAGAGTGTPLNRNLSMLQVAGQSLLSSGFGGGAGGGAPPTSAAARAFPPQAPAFSGGGGAPAMMGAAAAAQSTVAGLPHQLLRPLESLEDVIKRHENELMDRIVSQMEEETRRATDAAVEAQLQAAWEADRAAWMQEHCGMMGVTSNTAATTTALTPLSLANGGAAASGGRLVDASLPPYRSPDPRGFLSGPTAGTPLEESLVQAHLKVVQSMKHSSTNGVSTSTIEQFLRILEGRPDPPTQGYSAAWHLVAQLMRSSSSNHNSSSAAVSQAKATLAHFCQQYRTHVLNTVRRSAASTSSSRYANDVTAQCEAYARLQLGSNFSTAPASASSPPWPVIYFCLRCGDAVAALEAVQTAAGGGAMMDPAVQRIVATLARAQGDDASSLWESTTVTSNDGGGGGGLLRLLDPTDMQTLADLLDSAKRMEQQPNNDNKVHEMGVYALLSAASDQPISSDTVEGFRRIEDYLTGALWRAVLRPNPVDELIGLGEMIQNWGASYFDDPTSGGWSFALPLFASQQYQKALQWLARSSRTGLLQAAHLGLVLSTVGVPIDNLGTQQDSVPDDAVASLLVAYASELLPMPGGSRAALTYLMRIPNEARARKEVAKLIANASEIEELVGTLNIEGMRQGGAIAEHFSDTKINFILVDAADMILAGSKDDDKKTQIAALCLMLAGRYEDVFSLMNEMLSPPDQPDDARKSWLERVESFRTTYIDKRTHVLEVLEREGKQSVVRTNRVLLDLNKFFHRLRSRLHDTETLAIAESLQLLPTSDIDRKAKESEYKNMDPLIQQVYPALLDGAMRILHEEHQRLKMNLHGDTSGVVRERLRELQAKAKLYTTFAASIGMANEHIRSISHHASLMI